MCGIYLYLAINENTICGSWRLEGNNDWTRLLSCYLPLQSPWSVTVPVEDNTIISDIKSNKTKFTHLVKICQIFTTKFQIQKEKDQWFNGANYTRILKYLQYSK